MTARPVDMIPYMRKDGNLLLSPPYQRGDVWGEKRQRNLIRSILLGVPIPSMIINDRFGAGWGTDAPWAVIDGKQRMTAILKFLDGDLDVPGEWFGMDGAIRFPDLPINLQRRFRHTPVPICEGHLKTLEEEQQVFDLVNFGGLAQGESDFTETQP